MYNSKLRKRDAKALQEYLDTALISHPLFMYYCPDKSKRAKYIDAFLGYHLPKWAKTGSVIIGPNKRSAAALIAKEDFEFFFIGARSLPLLLIASGTRERLHRKVTKNIVGVLVPSGMPVKVLTIFGDSLKDKDDIMVLVKQAAQQAKEENFVLVYETFSCRLIPDMEKLGFETGYQRNFMDTRFIQTLMTFNI